MFKDSANRRKLILFLFFTALAIFSFAYGLTSLNHREEGYYEIDVLTEHQGTLYDAGITLRYEVKGKSAEIRALLLDVQNVYSHALLSGYELLHADRTFDGVTNLASLNAAPNTEQVISDTLYDILTDALAKTEKDIGYSVFAGPLVSEWETLRYLSEPEPVDPANSPEEAARIDALVRAIHTEPLFSLTLSDKGSEKTAELHVSDSWEPLLTSLEMDAVPVLHLGLLQDAYLMRYVADALSKAGYTSGILNSASGLSLVLQDIGTQSFGLLSQDGIAAALSESTPCSSAGFTSFAPPEAAYGFYTVNTSGGILYRHPLVSVYTGMPISDMLSCLVTSPVADPVALDWQLLQLVFGQPADFSGYTYAFLRTSEGGQVIHSNASALDVRDSSFTLDLSAAP